MTALEDKEQARARLQRAMAETADGNRESFKQLYQMTSAKLFGIVLRICNERSLAEDVLQDVYVKIWRRAGRFDPDRASPITWLSTIARNTAIDAVRSMKVRPTAPDDAALEVADDRALAPEMIEADQAYARLIHCLDKLDEKTSRSIRRAFFDGSTYAELAEKMTVPLGTMKSWIRRGLIQLRGCVGDD